MADMLALSAHLPEVAFATGDTVVREGVETQGIWVLVSGALVVRKGDVVVATISTPGALVGEMSILLDTAPMATVEATEPSRLRHAVNGPALLSSHPEITKLVAIGLAERLSLATTYLSDLKHQYGDAPGISMVSDVLTRISQHGGFTARPGSRRDPDPDPVD
jgi:CRP-like cAMP-binding protein